MSHRENVDLKYIDTEYSSGDSKNMKSKQQQEENNNEIDELSKNLTEMGCIVGAVKRPPNICVENCVYESEDEKSAAYGEEENYSDEFEEDKSEDEETKETKIANNESKSVENDVNVNDILSKSSMKLSKSQSCMSSKPQSISGRSTSFGSASVPSTRRVNMSFTNERVREIERHNHILLTKILSARNERKSSIPPREQPTRRPVPSAAVTRKNKQRQIDHDNMILLKKIQRAKSSACSIRR